MRVKREHNYSSNRVIRDGETKRPTRAYSKAQENTVAQSVGGNRQLNSGATMFAKGDVTNDNFLIECKTKTTHSESISIKREWIDKLIGESLFEGKANWAIAFNFGPNEPDYYIIDSHLFEALNEMLMEDRHGSDT